MEFLDTNDLYNDQIKLVLNYTQEGNEEKQFVPAYQFHICDLNGKIMGQISLRVGHNDRLYYGGNIGYGVKEEYRGHRYAYQACLLLEKLARKHDLEYLIITCDPNNIASSKTIQLANYELIKIADVPSWHNMYDEGKLKVMVYKKQLKK